MDPTRWGPKLWFFMHTLSFNYPEQPTIKDKKDMKIFFENLRALIPCNTCKEHYNKHLDNDPIDNALTGKDKLIMWVLNLHNKVNESLDKPVWSKEQVYEHYNHIYSGKCNINQGKCTAKPKKTLFEQHYKKMSLLILIGILILLIYLIRKKDFKCYNI